MRHIKIQQLIFALLLITLLVGCGKVVPEDTTLVASTTETEEAELVVTPPPATDWSLLKTIKVDHNVNTAGFINELKGVTVGFMGTTFCTDNGGETWTESANQSLCRFGLDMISEEIMISCGNGGENRISTDGGQNWTTSGTYPLSNGEPHQFIFMIDELNTWVASKNSIGLTTDGGETYEEVSLPESIESIMTLYFSSITDGYLIGDDGFLYITTDGGATYTKRSEVVNPENLSNKLKSRNALHFTDSENGLFVYTGADYQLYVLSTNDSGNTWTSETAPTVINAAINISNNGEIVTLFVAATKEIHLITRTQ